MRARYLLFLASMMLCSSAQSSEIEKPLEGLNVQFRNIYAAERQAIRQADSPVIIARTGKLILLRGGKREERDLLDADWQFFKMVDHVPLSVYVLLLPCAGEALSPPVMQTLQALPAQIKAALDELSASDLPAPSLVRQQAMLHATTVFVEKVASQGSVSKSELDSFAGSMGAPSLKNAYDAEAIELRNADDCVQKWRRLMSPAEWSALHVIVMDGHMPRAQEHLMQYFFALLKQHREGGKVIFVEGSDDEDAALNLLATHQLDEQVAVSFFHDSERMHRDLLADGARSYLKQHPPR